MYVCMYVRVCVDLGHQVSWRSLTTVYVVWFEELIFFGLLTLFFLVQRWCVNHMWKHKYNFLLYMIYFRLQ
jgi:hypothetical protein